MQTFKISFLVFILSITISAQWYQQNSGTNETLYGVNFTDSHNGTTVGGNGTILRTADGGGNCQLKVVELPEDCPQYILQIQIPVGL